MTNTWVNVWLSIVCRQPVQSTYDSQLAAALILSLRGQRPESAEEQRLQSLEDQCPQSPLEQRLQSPEEQKPQTLKEQRQQEQRPQCPKDQRLQSPEEQEPQSPEEQGPQSPEEQGPQSPEEQGPQSPEEQGQQSPEEQGPQSPEEQRPQSPEEQRPQSPEEQRPQSTEEQRLQSPEEQQPQSPEEQQLQSPEEQQSQSTEEQRPQSPEEQQSQSTEEQQSQSPWQQQSQSPEEQGPQSPEEQGPQSPEEQGPQSPEEQGPQSPEEQGPQSPEEQRPQSPKEQRPQSPGEQRPQSPGEQRPQSLGEQRPQSPEEQRPQSPEEQRPQSPEEQPSQSTEEQRPQITEGQWLEEQRPQSTEEQRLEKQRLQSTEEQRPQSTVGQRLEEQRLQRLEEQRLQSTEEQRSQSTEEQRLQSVEEQRMPSMEDLHPQNMEEQSSQSMKEQQSQSVEASQFQEGRISNCIQFNKESLLQPVFQLGTDNGQKRPPYDTSRRSRFGHILEDLDKAVFEEKESQNGNRSKKDDGDHLVVTNEYKGSEDPCELQIGHGTAVPEEDHANIVKHKLEKYELKSKDAEVKTKNEVQENVNNQQNKDVESDEREEVYEMMICPNSAVKLTESQSPKQTRPKVKTTEGESKAGAATDEEEMLKDFCIPRRRGRPPRRGSTTRKVPTGNRSCGAVRQRKNIEKGGDGKDTNKGNEKTWKGRSNGKPVNVKKDPLVGFDGENENRGKSQYEEDFVEKKKDQSKEENASAVQGGRKECDEGKVDGNRVGSGVELVGKETNENRSGSGNNDNSENKGKGKNSKRKKKGKDGDGTERKRSKKMTIEEKGITSSEVRESPIVIENLQSTQTMGLPSSQSPGKQSCCTVGQRDNTEKMQKGGNGRTNGKFGNVKKELLIAFEGENENRKKSQNEEDFVDQKKDQSKEENASAVQGHEKECDTAKVDGKGVGNAVELVGSETNENRSVSGNNNDNSEKKGKGKNRKRKEKGKDGEGTERKRSKKMTIKEKGRTSSEVQDGPIIVENLQSTQTLGLPSPQSPGARNVEHLEGVTGTLDRSERLGGTRRPECRSPTARTQKLTSTCGPGARSPGGSLRLEYKAFRKPSAFICLISNYETS
uniref:trichohyalin-like n=1 Tax=Myxine glutinosa TaxID=7769 RepID=UPI00358E61B3